SVLNQSTYRWYQNVDSVTPTTALAGENAAASGGVHETAYRLRMNGLVPSTPPPVDQRLRLQYSPSQSGPRADRGAPGPRATWAGYDNPSVADGTVLPGTLLSNSTSGARQTYEEANTTLLTPSAVSVNQRAEWDWAVMPTNAAGGQSYYFRMVREDGTPFE